MHMKYGAATRQAINFAMNERFGTRFKLGRFNRFAVFVHEQEILRCAQGFVFTRSSYREVKLLGVEFAHAHRKVAARSGEPIAAGEQCLDIREFLKHPAFLFGRYFLKAHLYSTPCVCFCFMSSIISWNVVNGT
ncbi:hypothetical protein D1872_261340 [compost metagenome]